MLIEANDAHNNTYNKDTASAYILGSVAHKDQFRKFTKIPEPYFEHCKRVASILRELDDTTCDEICAAYLHDILEDIAIPQNELLKWMELIFLRTNVCVLSLVWELTKKTQKIYSIAELEKMSRNLKWEIDLYYLKTTSNSAKKIKLADRIDNLSGYIPKSFLKKYLPESRDILRACQGINKTLEEELASIIEKKAKLLS